MNVEIIAELAQGFEGKPEQAKLLMQAANSANADSVKYQLVYADELATPDYQYYDLFKSLEMPDEVWKELADYAIELGINLHLDIFGEQSLILAEKIEADAIKLHGTDIANIGLLEKVANCRVQKVILGAGGAFINEIKQALAILNKKTIIVLFGFQGYPTPNDTNQISRIQLFNKIFNEKDLDVKVGFADHAEPNTELAYSLAATAIGAGAEVIEKHLTLGKSMKLEDHESALNPDEFSVFTETVRSCVAAYGNSKNKNDFGMSESEYQYREMIRRHVVTTKQLKNGTIIQPEDVGLKRTSAESNITHLEKVYNKTVIQDIKKNAPVKPDDIN